MKRIFTLVFALGTLAVAQAQPGSRDNRDNRQNVPVVVQPNDQRGYDNGRDVVYDRNDRYDHNDRFSNDRRRNMEIAQINREYDFKIQKVRNSFFMSRFEKERQIRWLQEKRQREIKMVYYKYSDRRDDRHDRDDRNNHHY